MYTVVLCILYLFEEVVSGVVDELLEHLRPAHTGSSPPSLGVTSLQDLKWAKSVERYGYVNLILIAMYCTVKPILRTVHV